MSRIVRTEDGVRLHVEEDGATDAPVTVVFSHGFTAELGEFMLQRDALRDHARLVLYDQRGHGKSDCGHWEHSTIDQLGRDLQRVIEVAAPTGPVVLVGHSMGGMTLMAWARQFPEEIGARVVGAFLLATSAWDVITTGPVGRLVKILTRLHLLRFYLTLLRLVAPVLQRVRKRGSKLGYRWVRHFLFGTDDADPALVVLVQAMLESTAFTTSVAFYPTFISHDEREALPLLRAIPTTILCGTSDRLTPASHSRGMAEVLGDSTELVLVPGAGHSVNITRPEIVDAALLRLLDRVTRSAAA